MSTVPPPKADGAVGSWKDEVYWVLGQRVTLLASHRDTNGAFGLIEIVSPGNAMGPPPHHHEDCLETFHVVEGALEVLKGSEWIRLEAGESLCVPQGVVHSFRNPDAVPARTLSVFTPGGFDDFFRDLGARVSDPSEPAPPVTPEIIERVVSTAASYGMILEPARGS